MLDGRGTGAVVIVQWRMVECGSRDALKAPNNNRFQLGERIRCQLEVYTKEPYSVVKVQVSSIDNIGVLRRTGLHRAARRGLRIKGQSAILSLTWIVTDTDLPFSGLVAREMAFAIMA